MADFLARNWGNVASVVGLVFSILAFVFSKRASKAAREARDAAMRQSLGEDMQGALRSAQDIVTYLRDDKIEMTLLRIGDLMNQCSYLSARWEPMLSEKSRNNLHEVAAELRSMHSVLAREIRGDMAKKARLAKAAQRVSSIFNEERGTAANAAEQESE
ncbi:MAG: hypothetical protein ABSC93_26705 [Bryobacteraceae bacterium]|jgi:hypothetical protein